MVVNTAVLANKPQKGSPISWAYRLILLVLIVILIVVLIGVVYFASQLAEYGATLNPSTWDDAAKSYFEDKTGLDDTGDGAGESALKGIFWSGPFGIMGGLLGIGTEKSGLKGVGEAFGKSGDSWYTFILRILG